jgi:chitodextrinase
MRRGSVCAVLLAAVAAATLPTATGAGYDRKPPSSPRSVTLTSATSSSLSLSWQSSTDRGTGVAGYRLYLGGSFTAATQATSYTFAQLVCGHSYTLGVQSYDRAGNRSATVSIVASTAPCPDTTPPTAPTSLTQTGSTQSSVSLSWSASSDNVGVAAYNVYRDGSAAGTAQGTSYTFGGLACGRSYTLSVEALDASGNASPRSAVLAGTSPCPDTVAPAPPTFLVQTAATASTIALSWAASIDNVGVAGYRVYVNGVGGSTTTLTSYSVANLSCGKTYTLGVDAFDAAGNRSSQTSVIAATSACAATPPPGGTLTFTPAADARVEEANSGSNFGTSFLRVDGGTDPRVETDLRFVVGGVSGTVTGATLRLYASTDTVDGPSLHVAGDSWSENGVTWNTRPTPAANASGDSSLIVSGTWVDYDVSAIVRGAGTYDFTLATGSSDGVNFDSREGSQSPRLVVTTSSGSPTTTPRDTQAPTAPTSLAATGVTASTVALAWLPSTDDVGVAGYSVYVNGARNASTSLTAYSVVSLACGKTYTFGVEAYDAAGNVSSRTTVSGASAACSVLPPSIVCSKTLSAGGDLSSFVASLRPGEVGCLRGGTYTDGTKVTWSVDGTASSPITLTEYPGEQAEIVGTTFDIVGDYLTVRDLTIRDVPTLDYDGLAVSGTGDRIEHNVIERTARHGILLHTNARGITATRNFIADVGLNSSNTLPDHGIYVQGLGGSVTSNVLVRMKGYGIHVYGGSGSMPSDYVIAENTTFGSREKGGILVDTPGGDIRVINNVSAENASYGIINRRCDGGGCIVDTNLVYGNGSGGISGPATNTIASNPLFLDALGWNFRLLVASPAINAGRSDYSYVDLDGRARVSAPDLGALESAAP